MFALIAMLPLELQRCIVHSVCFISNVYKQRFSGLVKIFKNLSNRTSQDFDAKQYIFQMVDTKTLGDLLVKNFRKLF